MSAQTDKKMLWQNLAFFTSAVAFCLVCWWGIIELFDDPVRALLAIFN